MNIFTYLFLVALIGSYAVQFWLIRRQDRHVLKHRDQVPDAFKESIALNIHQKAADYTLAKNRLSKFSGSLDAILLLFFTLGGGISLIAHTWSTVEISPIIGGAGLILSILLIFQLVELPLAIYHTFGVEEKFGFNRSTPRQFMVDQVLHLVLTLALGGPLVIVVLWVMRDVGALWWLLAWLILITFYVFLTWAYPTLIAPLFNRFTVLDNEELKARIEALLERCGFSSKGIFVMDGSRRSGHGNAYFTGFGSHKRIVFFDTLINTLNLDEVEAVLAHELGHFKRRHVIKMLTAGTALSLIGLAILGWISRQDWFYTGLGVDMPSNAAALVLFVLVSPVFTIFLRPVFAYVQRRHEFEADDFASMFAQPASLISALIKLYRDNATTLTPDPLYMAFHYSHPPAAIRIANLAEKGIAPESA
ncbi:MAG: M48 family metallopeptidase [Methylococcaceae bacterium]|nr:M48 family metallopeptidase [Methylococcaceae bacterium]MCI0666847.1 M48 family metallopeptidase [Methylococcaceae bacterium]MCI0733946.1 M48 family metallopeptidase [Methylococcaceae bacterium]